MNAILNQAKIKLSNTPETIYPINDLNEAILNGKFGAKSGLQISVGSSDVDPVLAKHRIQGSAFQRKGDIKF